MCGFVCVTLGCAVRMITFSFMVMQEYYIHTLLLCDQLSNKEQINVQMVLH